MALPAGGSISLGFSDEYTAPDGRTCTHHGVDVAMPVGASVEAPVNGDVTFAGRVPGPHGGTVLAVTLLRDDGNKVTLMPLEDVTVSAGEHVAIGKSLGSVAASGDPSSARPHIHVSLRKGTVYLDPAPLLVVVPAPSTGVADPAPVSVSVPVPPPAYAPVLSPGGVGAGQWAPVSLPSVPSPVAAPAAAGLPLSASVLAPAPALQAEVFPAGSVAADGFSEGASLSDVPDAQLAVQQQTQPAHAVGSGARAAARSAWSAAPTDVRAAIAPNAKAGLPAIPVSAVLASIAKGLIPVIAAAVMGAAMFLSCRAIIRQATEAGEQAVSSRFGKLLQHLKTGGTLSGLTSCSGP